MKRLLVLLGFAAAVAIAAAIALAASGRSSPTAISPTNLPTAAPTGQMTLYGHIITLKRDGGRFEMRFDPAWYTEGLTARVAYHGTVPNDRYVIEEGHQSLTYIVASNAKMRVLTNHGTGPVLVPIKLGELMRIVNGGPHRKLFEPLSTGVWIRVHTDTIQEINQQYQP
jgi:cytochrome c-type biogenesis protein CcmE